MTAAEALKYAGKSGARMVDFKFVDLLGIWQHTTTKDVPQAPGSLDEALERDHAFLLKGDVFTPEVISTWIAYKRENELDAVRLLPHPYEFALYFDN